MAAAVRTWLTELQSGDPAAARAVGAATLALLAAADSLGPPLVRELGQAARLNDTHTALERAYERGQDIMRDVRRAAADAATARKRAEYQLGEAQALLAGPGGRRTCWRGHRHRHGAVLRSARRWPGLPVPVRESLAGSGAIRGRRGDPGGAR